MKKKTLLIFLVVLLLVLGILAINSRILVNLLNEKPPIQITSSALFPAMDIQTLIKEANYIVIGKIEKQLPAKLAKAKNGNPYVYTNYQLKVEQELKNPLLKPGQTWKI